MGYGYRTSKTENFTEFLPNFMKFAEFYYVLRGYGVMGILS